MLKRQGQIVVTALSLSILSSCSFMKHDTTPAPQIPTNTPQYLQPPAADTTQPTEAVTPAVDTTQPPPTSNVIPVGKSMTDTKPDDTLKIKKKVIPTNNSDAVSDKPNTQ